MNKLFSEIINDCFLLNIQMPRYNNIIRYLVIRSCLLIYFAFFLLGGPVNGKQMIAKHSGDAEVQ